VILAGERIDEAVGFCRKACDLGPDDPKYAYTLAYHLYVRGQASEAASRLKAITEKYPKNLEAQALLKKILSEQE
jgi:Flp pilus assembly protein TadD